MTKSKNFLTPRHMHAPKYKKYIYKQQADRWKSQHPMVESNSHIGMHTHKGIFFNSHINSIGSYNQDTNNKDECGPKS